MAVLPVVPYPNPILREVATDVAIFDDRLQKLTVDMVATMRAANAHGIAAPQVGVLKRIIAINVGGDDPHALVLVNPVIETMGTDRMELSEGCLSFPRTIVEVRRSLAICVIARDITGREGRMVAAGLEAQAIQHEIEHLDGKLLIDHAKPIKRQLIEKRSRKRSDASLWYGHPQDPARLGAQQNAARARRS